MSGRLLVGLRWSGVSVHKTSRSPLNVVVVLAVDHCRVLASCANVFSWESVEFPKVAVVIKWLW